MNYTHTFNVLKRLPAPLEGYENPAVSSLLSDETSAVTIMLQNNSLSSGRLYEIEQNAEQGASTVLEINDPDVLSVFVGNNVNEIGFNGCRSLKAVEFADPTSITKMKGSCFNSISSEILIDFSSFTNLRDVGTYVFNNNVKFTNNRLVFPTSLSGFKGTASNIAFCTTSSVNEIEFKPSNELSNTGSSVTYVTWIVKADKAHLSSIILNDMAVKHFLKSSSTIRFCQSNSNSGLNYRKLSVDTLSDLHDASSIGNVGLFNSNAAVLSGDVYTFSNFPLSDLEDQDSHAFDEYVGLIPNEKFMSTSLANAFQFDGLSVWVPTALYETWQNEWPNYASCVHSYGPWEDRRSTRELTFLLGRSYVIAPQTHKALSVLNQSGPTTVNLSAYDIDVIEIPDNQNN